MCQADFLGLADALLWNMLLSADFTKTYIMITAFFVTDLIESFPICNLRQQMNQNVI
jgi:hypothetical protein